MLNDIFSYLDFDYEKIRDCLSKRKEFIRVNTLSVDAGKIKETLKDYIDKETPIDYVFSLKIKKAGKLPEFKAGLIHVQSFSSCLVPLAFSSFDENDVVLDATASPGGKTSHMAALMNNKGVIIANDRKARHRELFSTLSRLGVINTCVTSYDAKKLPFKNYFTKVLLDPPCSALGAHINAWKRLQENKNVINTMAKIQKEMILSCFDALKEGGELVYSTCTITKEENEEVIDYLLENRENSELESFYLPVECDKGLSGFVCSEKVKRIYPWHVDSDSFFIAKIRKVK